MCFLLADADLPIGLEEWYSLEPFYQGRSYGRHLIVVCLASIIEFIEGRGEYLATVVKAMLEFAVREVPLNRFLLLFEQAPEHLDCPHVVGRKIVEPGSGGKGFMTAGSHVAVALTWSRFQSEVGWIVVEKHSEVPHKAVLSHASSADLSFESYRAPMLLP